MNFGPFILLHGDDNVLVCREHATVGQVVTFDDADAALSSDIDVGHKIARYDLKAGDKIYKYGAPIGSMTADAQRGGHVHMHNMKSDYISSHTREATGHG
ncbi:D-galactarate dehydratase/Altronate hydrolase [Asticcacaulis sp. AC460]|uniref:UxaA family hydrolase n=1 Tax=Asticcacaulis sp. AC460 TaxID=1282360 RepID=UPI0003C406BD|nr:UxaA family hydrolase [Asticcacaulis sp. AC460]ESQ87107.1 D-galactarate dehydratase/Altronate hydrolase [Asticcacaulis sp. AC460]